MCRNLAAELGVSTVVAYKMDATTALLQTNGALSGQLQCTVLVLLVTQNPLLLALQRAAD